MDTQSWLSISILSDVEIGGNTLMKLCLNFFFGGCPSNVCEDEVEEHDSVDGGGALLGALSARFGTLLKSTSQYLRVIFPSLETKCFHTGAPGLPIIQRQPK